MYTKNDMKRDRKREEPNKMKNGLKHKSIQVSMYATI